MTPVNSLVCGVEIAELGIYHAYLINDFEFFVCLLFSFCSAELWNIIVLKWNSVETVEMSWNLIRYWNDIQR